MYTKNRGNKPDAFSPSQPNDESSTKPNDGPASKPHDESSAKPREDPSPFDLVDLAARGDIKEHKYLESQIHNTLDDWIFALDGKKTDLPDIDAYICAIEENLASQEEGRFTIGHSHVGILRRYFNHAAYSQQLYRAWKDAFPPFFEQDHPAFAYVFLYCLLYPGADRVHSRVWQRINEPARSLLCLCGYTHILHAYRKGYDFVKGSLNYKITVSVIELAIMSEFDQEEEHELPFQEAFSVYRVVEDEDRVQALLRDADHALYNEFWFKKRTVPFRATRITDS